MATGCPPPRTEAPYTTPCGPIVYDLPPSREGGGRGMIGDTEARAETQTETGAPEGDERTLLEHLVLDFRQMTQFAQEPWVFTRGEGVRFQDEAGAWYLDGLSGVFVNSLGYGNERVLGAAIEQLRTLHFAPPLNGTTRPAMELGARLPAPGPGADAGPERGGDQAALRRLRGHRSGPEDRPAVLEAGRSPAQVQGGGPLRGLPRGHHGGPLRHRQLGAQERLRAPHPRLPAPPPAPRLP